MRLNKNIASLNIYREYSKNLIKQSNSLGQISTGIKINSSKDNPSAMAQSERLRMQIRGLQMAARNSQNGISLIQTAQGGLEGITDNLQKIRELLVQSRGITTPEDREVIQKDINQMIQGAKDMADNTQFNGVNLLVGGDNNGTVTIKTVSGANVGEKIDIPRLDMSSKGLGLTVAGVAGNPDVVTVDVNDVDKSLGIVDDAIDVIIAARSKFGALCSRLEGNYNSTIEISDKIQFAESDIRDADIAEEIMEYTKYNLLVEAGTAMMVQSNKLPQDALRILENVRAR
ncbi:flagellin [Clostridium sp. CF012]|uniref:flagellin N-terminal helical domain-containing protein n=1 Tax=Clostridium sp. CF012 TaxID=2843319 RepID=UPI001C0D6E56|nr:flagellin [Clostridium sp. CF012]MBU3142315.1 flagellin [Clostridium sp. CF012]